MEDKTKEILGENLNSGCISQRSKGGVKLDYIESHHAIREANRAFGFDGWSYDIISLSKVSEEKNANGNNVIGYIARVQVNAGGVIREDVGFGSGISKTLADAHEGATKEAVSDAMKRALRTFGDIFGLALYDKKKAHVDNSPVKKEESAKKEVPKRNWIEEIKLCDNMGELQSIVEEASKSVKGKERADVIREKDIKKVQFERKGE